MTEGDSTCRGSTATPRNASVMGGDGPTAESAESAEGKMRMSPCWPVRPGPWCSRSPRELSVGDHVTPPSRRQS